MSAGLFLFLQYAIIALAVLGSVVYLLRRLVRRARRAAAGESGCAVCGQCGGDERACGASREPGEARHGSVIRFHGPPH